MLVEVFSKAWWRVSSSWTVILLDEWQSEKINTDHVGSSLAMVSLGKLLVAVGRHEAVGEGAPDCLGHCVELCGDKVGNYVGKEGGRNGDGRLGGLGR